ncbi:MAG: DUF1554 domain-containing protein [Legionella sp.]|nr:DUF1554 domain-containing protein [Legionella sp.]
MKKGLAILISVLLGGFTYADPGPGPLFTTAITPSSITITPTARHYYPSMGIKITTPGVSVGGCIPHSNGYCLFDASNTAPRTLTLTGAPTSLQGIICLEGQAILSCQRFGQSSIAACQAGGFCGAFVTSTTSNGNLGGLSGGNTICQTRATAVGLTGVWRAWLSTTTVTAVTNILYNSTVTYVRSSQTGTVIAPPGTLLSGSIATTFLTEDGFTPAGVGEVYTGTQQNGTPAVNTCADWTSNGGVIGGQFGVTTSTNASWTASNIGGCNVLRRLYCFQAPV